MKYLVLLSLLLAGCSYRMVLPQKFKKGDCIAITAVRSRYIHLITRSSWGRYVTCQTDETNRVWYGCDTEEKRIFQDLIDENNEKVPCPDIPFGDIKDKEWYEKD